MNASSPLTSIQRKFWRQFRTGWLLTTYTRDQTWLTTYQELFSTCTCRFSSGKTILRNHPVVLQTCPVVPWISCLRINGIHATSPDPSRSRADWKKPYLECSDRSGEGSATPVAVQFSSLWRWPLRFGDEHVLSSSVAFNHPRSMLHRRFGTSVLFVAVVLVSLWAYFRQGPPKCDLRVGVGKDTFEITIIPREKD